MRPHVRPVLASASAVVSLLLAASSTLVFLSSSRLLRRPRPPARPEVSVLGSDSSRLLLSGPAASRPGRWGLYDGSGGYVQVGDPVPAGEGRFFRPVLLSFQPVSEGVAWVERQAFPSDLDACVNMFPFLRVGRVVSPSGPLPSLRDDSLSSTAFVGVHGRGVSPSEWLRVLPQVRRRGWRFVSVSFCNDGFGPDARFSGLGWSEADDLRLHLLDLADAGVSSVVLGGISFGGAVVGSLLARFSFFAGGRMRLRLPDDSGGERELEVVGLMLEAPALDWPRVLAHVASGARLPPLLTGPVLSLSLLRARLDPDSVRPLARLDRALFRSAPLLLFHGVDDAVVPVEVSDELASAHASAVFLRLPGAGHAEAFNVAAELYDRAVSRFFSELG